ncbi:hypothetical protein [Dongia sp. agr-C8]
MRRLARAGLVLLAVLFLIGLARAPVLAEAPGEFEAWSAIERAPTDAALVDFLVKYPQSPFRQKAAALLADLRGTSPADVLDQYGGYQSVAPGSAAPAAAAPAALSAPPLPAGTYARSGREDYDDKSGSLEWEDELVLNADGTAELTVKYRTSLRTYWYLTGCESSTNYSPSPRVGTYRWKRKYTVTVDATTMSLQPQGPAEISWIDPYCWKPGAGTGGEETWVLDWVDGRLSDEDGAFTRKY